LVKCLGIIVQAHMGSTRLPNKMLKNLCGKSVVGHVISRLKLVNNAEKLIIATSDLSADDLLVKECEKYDVAVVRGSDSDVLARFYKAAKEHNLTDVVRICADNTLVDWNLLAKEIDEYQKHENIVVVPGDNVPLGLGGEIFSFSMLEEAYENGKEHYHREHVTPYIYEHHNNVVKVDYKENYRKYRLTLDTGADWELIQRIYSSLYDGNNEITFEQVAEILQKNPVWVDINSHIKQKSVKAESVIDV